jgi:cytochrome c oxidase subunit 2
VFFFVLIVALMVAFVVRYRRRPGREDAEDSAHHSTALELTWTLIPIAIVVFIFAWGFKVYLDLNTPPANSYEILVTGQKWKWLFTYPNGHVDENLHVPLDTPVRLVMTSEDVIHGFYIPAFRLKRDVVPGRYVKVWFRAIKPGEYQIYCTQYCGTGHSDMWAKVVVHEPGGFERWLDEASNFLKTMSPAEAGEKHWWNRADVQGAVRAPRAARGRQDGDRRRGLHPRVDPRPAGQDRARFSARHADVPGPAEGPGDHCDHRVRQDGEVGARRCLARFRKEG